MVVSPSPEAKLAPNSASWLKLDGSDIGNWRFVASGCTWSEEVSANGMLFEIGGKYEFSGKEDWIDAVLLWAYNCCVPTDGPGIGFHPSHPAPCFGNEGPENECDWDALGGPYCGAICGAGTP